MPSITFRCRVAIWLRRGGAGAATAAALPLEALPLGAVAAVALFAGLLRRCLLLTRGRCGSGVGRVRIHCLRLSDRDRDVAAAAAGAHAQAARRWRLGEDCCVRLGVDLQVHLSGAAVLICGSICCKIYTVMHELIVPRLKCSTIPLLVIWPCGGRTNTNILGCLHGVYRVFL